MLSNVYYCWTSPRQCGCQSPCCLLLRWSFFRGYRRTPLPSVRRTSNTRFRFPNVFHNSLRRAISADTDSRCHRHGYRLRGGDPPVGRRGGGQHNCYYSGLFRWKPAAEAPTAPPSRLSGNVLSAVVRATVAVAVYVSQQKYGHGFVRQVIPSRQKRA